MPKVHSVSVIVYTQCIVREAGQCSTTGLLPNEVRTNGVLLLLSGKGGIQRYIYIYIYIYIRQT